MSEPIEIQLHRSLAEIAPEDWDACARADFKRPVDPFTTYRFLKALEDSGSVGPGTGWQPQYLTAHAGSELIAVAPLYAKGHSQGEYVFDHNWAHAYQNAGGRYYPKLQIAVPFTPATGRRFLTKPGYEEIGQAALVQGALQIGEQNQLSSLHVTFCTDQEVEIGREMGLLHRTGQQFHWVNEEYADFDGFLATLSSRKRKAIRKERREVAALEDGLDHQIAVSEGGHVGAVCDRLGQRQSARIIKFALRHLPLDQPRVMGFCRGQRGLGRINHSDVVPSLGKGHGNAAPHGRALL